MQVITVLAGILLLLANSGTVFAVQERILLGRPKLVIVCALESAPLSWIFYFRRPQSIRGSIVNTIKELWTTTVNLPPVIRQIVSYSSFPHGLLTWKVFGHATVRDTICVRAFP